MIDLIGSKVQNRSFDGADNTENTNSKKGSSIHEISKTFDSVEPTQRRQSILIHTFLKF